MSEFLSSDFPDGGSSPSNPISPVREAPFPDRIEVALRSGSRGKNFAEKIRVLCCEIPSDPKNIRENQEIALLDLAFKCRAVGPIRKLLKGDRSLQEVCCTTDADTEQQVSYRTDDVPKQITLIDTFFGGSQSKNFVTKIEELCTRLPKNICEFTITDLDEIFDLADDCRCVKTISSYLGYMKNGSFVAKRRARAKRREILTAEQRAERMRVYRNEYKKQRAKRDVGYRILRVLRHRFRMALGRSKKSGKTLVILGCSLKQLREQLESQWQPGMSWGNYGLYGWHIDHIRPCASFDLSIPEEQAKCFHHTNLQPLWAKDNIIKGARYRKDNES